MLTIGIIGGTGIPDFENLKSVEHIERTPYGEVPVRVHDLPHGRETRRIIFLSRHGAQRNVPPHRINYRSNICALKQLGCSAILATAAAGCLRRDWAVGSLALIDQFIDFTKARAVTFFEEGLSAPIHVDVTQPYCPSLRSLLKTTAQAMSVELSETGTYVCAEGPRFESAAEIRMMARWGGDLVGMTQVPEVVLAREAEICYAAVAIVTNVAAGITSDSLNHREVLDVMHRELPRLSQLLFSTAQRYVGGDCFCRHALDEYREMGVL